MFLQSDRSTSIGNKLVAAGVAKATDIEQAGSVDDDDDFHPGK